MQERACLPRRTATGFDYYRMAIIIAVLEKRLGYFFGGLDVYINIVGGLKLDDTAADLSVALALYSGLTDKVISDKLIALGEIGLGGELRSISHCEQRLAECERMGFETCIVPAHSLKSVDTSKFSMKIIGVRSIREVQSYRLIYDKNGRKTKSSARYFSVLCRSRTLSHNIASEKPIDIEVCVDVHKLCLTLCSLTGKAAFFHYSV